MQPFERLRAIARWSEGIDEDSLLVEAIDCLAGFDDDPAGLVVACRRLLSYHGYSARLWWICSRVIGSMEPRMMAWDTWDQLENDATSSYLGDWLDEYDRPLLSLGWFRIIDQLGGMRPDLEIVVVRTGDDNLLSRSLRNASASIRVVSALEASSLDPFCVLIPIAIAAAGEALVTSEKLAALNLLKEVPAVGVAPIGTVLSPSIVKQFLSANESLTFNNLPNDLVTTFAGPSGIMDARQFVHRRDAPDAPELLRTLG